MNKVKMEIAVVVPCISEISQVKYEECLSFWFRVVKQKSVLEHVSEFT